MLKQTMREFLYHELCTHNLNVYLAICSQITYLIRCVFVICSFILFVMLETTIETIFY